MEINEHDNELTRRISTGEFFDIKNLIYLFYFSC